MAIRKFKHNSLWLNGWGLNEDGKLVYIPLWDPPKTLTAALRNLIIADAVREAAKTVRNPSHIKNLRGISKRYSSSISAIMDADDNPCGTPWGGHPPIPWPPRSPIGPILAGSSPVIRNAITGLLVSCLGQLIGDKELNNLGNQISRS